MTMSRRLEIGTQRQATATKATQDFDKRSATRSEIYRPRFGPFVFVTPRHWPKHEQSAQEKHAVNRWHDVRAMTLPILCIGSSFTPRGVRSRNNMTAYIAAVAEESSGHRYNSPELRTGPNLGASFGRKPGPRAAVLLQQRPPRCCSGVARLRSDQHAQGRWMADLATQHIDEPIDLAA